MKPALNQDQASLFIIKVIKLILESERHHASLILESERHHASLILESLILELEKRPPWRLEALRTLRYRYRH